LSAANVAIGGLQQLEHNILYVFTNVAGFSERGGVDDGKRNIEDARRGLGQQRFAGARGTDQHDVRFRKLHFARLGAVHVDALVVVVNRDRKLLLGLLLADYVFIEEGFDLLRLGQVVRSGRSMRFTAIIFKNGIADGNTLVTNVSPGIIAGRRNELGDSVLRLVAKRTTQRFFWRSGLHERTPLSDRPLFSLRPCDLADITLVPLLMLIDNIVDDSVLFGLLCIHYKVALNVFFHFFQLLA